jgi:hypothetical protein
MCLLDLNIQPTQKQGPTLRQRMLHETEGYFNCRLREDIFARNQDFDGVPVTEARCSLSNYPGNKEVCWA